MFQLSADNLPALTWEQFYDHTLPQRQQQHQQRTRPHSAEPLGPGGGRHGGPVDHRRQLVRPSTALGGGGGGSLFQRPGTAASREWLQRSSGGGGGGGSAQRRPATAAGAAAADRQGQSRPRRPRTAHSQLRPQSSLDSLASVLGHIEPPWTSEAPRERPRSRGAGGLDRSQFSPVHFGHKETYAHASTRHSAWATASAASVGHDPSYDSQLFGAPSYGASSSPGIGRRGSGFGSPSSTTLSMEWPQELQQPSSHESAAAMQVFSLQVAAFNWKLQRKRRSQQLQSTLRQWTDSINQLHHFTAAVSFPFYVWNKYRLHRQTVKGAYYRLKVDFDRVRLKMIFRTWIRYYRREKHLWKQTQLLRRNQRRSMMAIVSHSWQQWVADCVTTRKRVLHQMLETQRHYQMALRFAYWRIYSHCTRHRRMQRDVSCTRDRLRENLSCDELPRPALLDAHPSPADIEVLEAFYNHSSIRNTQDQLV